MTPRRVSREYGILDAARTLIRSPQTLMSAASQTRAQSGRRTQPTSGGWVAIIVFAFLAGLGAIGALAAVGTYITLASKLDSPSTL